MTRPLLSIAEVIEDVRALSPLRRLKAKYFRLGYRQGERAGIRSARELAAAERRDEASASRQPYPNE